MLVNGVSVPVGALLDRMRSEGWAVQRQGVERGSHVFAFDSGGPTERAVFGTVRVGARTGKVTGATVSRVPAGTVVSARPAGLVELRRELRELKGCAR